MWKYVTKAVKDVIDKGTGIFNYRTLNIQERGSYNSVYEHFKYDKPLKQTETNVNDNDDNQETYNGNCNDNSQYLQTNFIKALTCSSAMVLGWYLSHFLCLQERQIKKKCLQKPTINNFLKTNGKNIFLFCKEISISQRVLAQPILLKSVNNNDNKHSVNDKRRNLDIENAAEQFAFVTGSLENQLGTAYLQQRQAEVGIEHFEAGALYKNASAAFNLGLCYEMGVGTTQNLIKAKQCYQIAAKMGHTKAMYNLAIYYIKGYGGLNIDFNQARLLFIAAAKKGHKESLAALNSECEAILKSQSSKPLNKENSSTCFVPVLNNA